MASRTFFVPMSSSPFYDERKVSFEYYPGFALSQQQKSIRAMHEAIGIQFGISGVLEVSTKSESALGVSLSAFNLTLNAGGTSSSVESFYQSSKRFVNGGPFTDIAYKSPLDAKRDSRLAESGALIDFVSDGISWPLLPSPNFYDFIYISALAKSAHADRVNNFKAFSDFAYSTQVGKQKKGKSWNCQARSLAIYSALSSQYERKEILNQVRNLAADRTRQDAPDIPTLF